MGNHPVCWVIVLISTSNNTKGLLFGFSNLAALIFLVEARGHMLPLFPAVLTMS